MGAIGLLALLSGLMMSVVFSSDDSDVPIDDTPVDDPDTPDDPEVIADTGASFAQTDDGVEIELGEDETGSLAMVYYEDDEESGTEVYEARFYLVPEGTDWSDASWETRGDVPGAETFVSEPGSYGYELADFEAQSGLELLGTVDLLPTLEGSNAPYPPQEANLTITANAPVESYFLAATTDGDELYSFLPEDYVITRNGVPETLVSEDITGTEGSDWLTAQADGITLDGAAGDDILHTVSDNVTLLGGAGDDLFELEGADNIVVDGGTGDDEVRVYGSVEASIGSATVEGGEGNDRIRISGGEAYGGEGNDELSSGRRYETALFGGAGSDGIWVYGEGSAGYGGMGDDFIHVDSGATGYGGAGDDRLQVDNGATAHGGAGDDLFNVWNQFRDEDGPAVITTDAGEDTIDVRIWNAFGGEADDIYLRVTDFDPAEDILQIGVFQTGNEVDSFELVEADDGSYTDVLVTYTTPLPHQVPSVAVIRLDGTTGLTADSVVVAA